MLDLDRPRDLRRVRVVGACLGGVAAVVCAGLASGDMVRLQFDYAGQAEYAGMGWPVPLVIS